MLREIVHRYGDMMKILNAVVGVVSAIILASLFAVMTTEIVSRYFFRMSYGWVMDYARFGFIYVAFFAGSILIHQDSHISITYVPDKIAPKAGVILKVLLSIVTLYFLSLVFRSGYVFAIQGATMYSTSRLTLLIYPRMAIPIGAVLMGLQVLNNTFKGLEKLFTYSAEDWQKLKDDTTPHKVEVIKEEIGKRIGKHEGESGDPDISS